MGSIVIGSVFGGALGSAWFVVMDDAPDEAFVCGGIVGCVSGVTAGEIAQANIYEIDPSKRC